MDLNSSSEFSSALQLKIAITALAILLGLFTVMAAFFSAHSRSRDKIRVKDVALLQEFLAAYKQDTGMYPAAASSKPTDWQKYLEYLPQAPASDGSCTKQQNNYSYVLQNDSQGYRLNFCLGSGTDNFRSGVNTVGAN